MTPNLQNPQQPPEWQEEGILRAPSYIPEISWLLFASCDRDANDRLDLIEAQSCVIMLDLADARVAFRRLDQDADGFLYWLEFDQIFRNAVVGGDGLYLRPARISLLDEIPDLETKAAGKPSAVEVTTKFDANQDEALDQTEVSALLKHYGLDPALAQQMRVLDANRSGSLDPTELASILQFIEFPSTVTDELQQESADSERFKFDANDDGLIELSELQRSLQALAPALIPWAMTIIEQADQNLDHRLSPTEIQTNH